MYNNSDKNANNNFDPNEASSSNNINKMHNHIPLKIFSTNVTQGEMPTHPNSLALFQKNKRSINESSTLTSPVVIATGITNILAACNTADYLKETDVKLLYR